MKKRKLLGLFLCLSLTVGSITPVTAFAAENQTVIEAAEESSFLGEEESKEDDESANEADESVDKDVEKAGDDADGSAEESTEEEESKEDPSEESKEQASEEGSSEASADEEVASENENSAAESGTSEEASEAEEESEASDDATLEATDETSLDASTDEASLEASDGPEKITDEELLEAGKTYEVKSFKTDIKTLKIKYDGYQEVKLEADYDLRNCLVKVDWTSTGNAVRFSEPDTYFTWDTKTKKCITSNRIIAADFGKAEVKATIGPLDSKGTQVTGNKTLQFSVVVDGVDYARHLGYKDGEKIKGWVNTDASGNILSLGKINQKAAATAYFDPQNGQMADGSFKIGKKLYLFLNYKLNKNDSRKGNVLETKNGNYFCIDKSGELKTGWQKITATGKEYYFDPNTGSRASKTWVTKGSNKVYVTSSGEPAEGFIRFETGESFYFVKGVVQTGFIYLDADRKKVSSGKAVYTMYCDPYASSKGDVILDGHFTLKGKDYYAGGKFLDKKGVPEGCVPVNAVYSFRDYIYITDKTGAVLKDKMVTLGGKTYYADKYGHVVTDTTMVVNGKNYHFDKDGAMSVVGADGTGEESKLFYEEGGVRKSAYLRSSNIKKANSAVYYYADAKCTRKLTNCFIYTSEEGAFPEAYLDKNGNFSTGLVKIGSDTYYFDPAGWVILGTGVVVHKGNFYLLAGDKLGTIVTGQTGFKYLTIGDATTDGKVGRWYYIKDKSGVLAKGKTVIDGKTYFFNDDPSDMNRGSLCYGGVRKSTGAGSTGVSAGDHWIITGYGERYYCNHNGQPLNNEADARACSILTGSLQHRINGGKLYVVNKDGMGYTGIYRYDGKMCQVSYGEIRTAYEDELQVIGGKTYLLGKDGYFRSGWQRLGSEMTLKYTDSLIELKVPAGTYFYFDPDTFEAATGWKKVPAPVLDKNGNIKGSGAVTELYFNENATQSLAKHAWVKGRDLTIKGKTYHFALSGTTVGEPVNKSGKADNKYYSPRTHMMEKNVLRKVGSKWFFFGSDGSVSDRLTGKAFDGSSVLATYNKDGSIKKLDVKNTLITVDGQYYGIGKNGLPVTGLYKLTADESKKLGGIKMYFEADGYCEGVGNTGKYALRKISGKFYVLKGAVVMPGNGMFRITDSSKLDMSDYYEIQRILSVGHRDITAPEGYSVFTYKDGVAKAGAFRLNGSGPIYTNKYGIAYVEISPIIKENGSWYCTLVSGNKDSEIVYMTSLTGEEPAYANIRYDKNKKILSINYATSIDGRDTGIPVTGAYVLFLQGSYPAPVCLKNGKFVTGNVKLTKGSASTTLYFDPKMAMAVTP